MVPEHHRPAKV